MASFWDVICDMEEEDFSPDEYIPEDYRETVLLDEVIVTGRFADQQNDHYTFLVTKVIEEEYEINRMISGISKSWDVSRLGKVEIILMRIAIVEALYCDDVPVITAIDEAIEISKFYAGHDSYTFINGVLDKVLKEFKSPKN